MTTRSHRCAAIAGVSLLLCILAGCQSGQPVQNTSYRPNDLVLAADRTYTNYLNALKTGKEPKPQDYSEYGIPVKYWTDLIIALKPMKVYTHRVNIVVAQGTSAGTEEGKYIYMPISSYLPRSGDDRFTFTPTDVDGVYDYERSQP